MLTKSVHRQTNRHTERQQTYKLPFFKTLCVLYVASFTDGVSRTKFYQDHTKNQTNKLKPATATNNDDVDEKTDSVVP